MDDLIKQIETSPWILAFMVIIGNIGFEYLKDEYEKEKCIQWLKTPGARKLVLFALIFSATKNIYVSFTATFAYFIFIQIS